jgi:hypothetical protein
LTCGEVQNIGTHRKHSKIGGKYGRLKKHSEQLFVIKIF